MYFVCDSVHMRVHHVMHGEVKEQLSRVISPSTV